MTAPVENPKGSEHAQFPEEFSCQAELSKAYGAKSPLKNTLKLVRRGETLALFSDGKQVHSAGINRPNMETIRSYRFNRTNYLLLSTRHGVTKTHFTFFLFLNPEGTGTLQLRSLSGSLGISYYQLECDFIPPGVP